jgi:hypothetical protein
MGGGGGDRGSVTVSFQIENTTRKRIFFLSGHQEME